MKSLVNDRGALLFLAMVGIYFLVFFSLSEIDEFIYQFVNHRSEYSAIEQLSKFTLLFVVVLAIKCLSHEKDNVLLQLAMVYLMFSMTMYLAESNMIREMLQPLFAAFLIPLLFHGFFKKKAWLSAIFLVLGLGVVALGVIKDFVVENQAVAEAMPLSLIEFMTSLCEERLDMVGIGFIGLSALILFYSSLRKFAQQGLIVNCFTILAIAIVAVGNGLSHYQYKPSAALWLTGLLMALIGGVGIFVMSHYLMDDEQKLFKENPLLYCLFFFFFFIFLPSFGGGYSYIHCLVLWLVVVFTSIRFYYDAKSVVR